MQGGYEYDLVIVLHDVTTLTFQLPIRVIDQDENTRSPGTRVQYILRGRETRER